VGGKGARENKPSTEEEQDIKEPRKGFIGGGNSAGKTEMAAKNSKALKCTEEVLSSGYRQFDIQGAIAGRVNNMAEERFYSGCKVMGYGRQGKGIGGVFVGRNPGS